MTEVDIAELGKGDEIEVRPGERIAPMAKCLPATVMSMRL